MSRKPLTEEQKIEAVYWIDELLRKHFDGNKTHLAQALGYAHGSAVGAVLAGRRDPNRTLYLAARKLWEEKKEGREEEPKTPPPPAPCPRGILADLDAVHADIGKVIDKLRRLSESCVPLLRPGLLQFAEKLERERKILEIA